MHRVVPARSSAHLLGAEGDGFRVILDGMNAEWILIGSECLGDVRFLLDRATEYARSRVVFGRPIGQNQGIQFPLARSHAETEATALMVDRAAGLFDRGQSWNHWGQVLPVARAGNKQDLTP